MKTLTALGICASCLLLADDAPRQKVQLTKTERMDFPTGGLLRLQDSIGELRIEAWDQPGLEITTTKTTKDEYDAANRQKGVAELDQVRIAAQRHGDELVLTTTFPHHHFSPLLDCHIYVPRKARLVIDHHGEGEVFVYDVAGDIHATVSHGTILLDLPAQGEYDIDARSKLGSVTSDFPGQTRKALWLVGHRLTGHAAGNARKLYLRAGYGDIIILKVRKPREPAPLRPAS